MTTIPFCFRSLRESNAPPCPSHQRLSDIPSHGTLQAGAGLQAAGKDIISLGIGEPDFTAPPQVVEALERAARSGLSGYSPTAGLPALREAIAGFYLDQFGARVDPGA